MDTVQILGINFLLELPVLLVSLIGCVVALLYVRRHGGASVLALSGFVLYLLQALISLALFGLLPSALVRQRWTPNSMINVMKVFRLIQSLAIAVSLILLLAAIFRGRSAQRQTT